MTALPPRSPARRAIAASALAAGSLLVLAGCATTSDAEEAGSGSEGLEIAGVEITVDEAAAELLPEEIAEAGAVEVATNAPYAPFEMFVEEGSDELTGVDVDLGRAIGAKLGVDFEFSQQEFDGLIPGLQAAKYDVVMAALTSSEERMDVLTFIDYSASGTGILVEAGNPEGIENYLDLCGKDVAVQAATNQVDLATGVWQGECEAEGLDPINLSEFPSDADAQLAITSGKAVASLLTKPSAGYVAKTTNDGETFEVVEDPESPNGYDATLNGIGVLKENGEFAKAIQAALQSLIDDGTYEAILDEYGVTGIGIDEATINGAAEAK
ncbi:MULTISPECIES: ABC transporter substrate-binding protein [unclassified Agromyces]|uniref:ABC transporter substrate-binding protein n=1 Tax=unclassified Agromyces TaxID=2639701 RepID=UPI0030145C11